MRAAIFCSKGLGDALLFMVIAQNLKNEGYKVDVYHDFIGELASWFIHFSFYSYSKVKNFSSLLSQYDKIIINVDDREISQSLCEYAKIHKPKQSWLLFPTTCKRKNTLGDFTFEREKSLVHNLSHFCQTRLLCKNVVSFNGIYPLDHLTYRKYPYRVVIHPTSSKTNRNWPEKKFIELVKILRKKGFSPSFILTQEEKEQWDILDKYNISAPNFLSLNDLANHIYESGYMIGNDSGIGHLASCLRIPSVTIFASRKKRFFWQPSWFTNERICAPLWILNCKGLRLREKYWDKFISVKKVIKGFNKLVNKYEKMCCL